MDLDRADGDARARMEGEVRAAVVAHLESLSALDAEAVAAGFAADAVFTSAEDEAVGQREVYALFRNALADVAALDMDVGRMVVTGDTAACELTERIRWRSGARLELQLAVFYTVSGGLITRVRVYRFLPG